MSKITQKQLIEQIKTLKSIKPRQEWASLLLSEIMYERENTQAVIKSSGKLIGIIDTFLAVFIQRKLAYSLALFAFVIVGIVGFAQYTVPGDFLFPVKKIAEQSQANLTGKTLVAQNIEKLNNRINDLAEVTKQGKKENIHLVFNEIQENASELSSVVKNGEADSTEVKEIAATLRVLSSINTSDGSDLTTDENLKDLYKIVVENQIAELELSTLTKDQQSDLSGIKDLYEKGKYTESLELILLINE